MIQLFKAMVSRRWIVATLIVVAAVTAFISLGFWQLDRLDQRRAANAELQAVLDGSALRLPADLPIDTVVPNREVIASGTFDYAEERLLVLQTFQGRNGVKLITPLRLDDGQTAVLVDRGWIPEAEATPENVSAYQIDEAVTVSGLIASAQTLRRTGSSNTSSTRPDNEIFRVDVAAIQEQLPYQLLPFYIVQGPNELDELPIRQLPEIDLSEGPHLGYAIQWFLFTIVTVSLYVVMVRRSVA